MAISTKIIVISRATGIYEKMKPQKGVLLTTWITCIAKEAKKFAVHRLFSIFNYDYMFSKVTTMT